MNIEESSHLFFVSLDDKLQEKHNEKIYEYESIVASAEYSNEENECLFSNLVFTSATANVIYYIRIKFGNM